MFLRLFIIALIAVSSATVQAVDKQSIIERIQLSGEVKVCIWPSYFAITYRNPKTSELSGIDIDMAKELASYLDVKLRFVESSFAHLIQNLNNHSCDIAMHGVGVRESRKKHMLFSKPYLSSGIYAISNKRENIIQKWTDIDQHGVVVVVQRGTYMEPVMRAELSKAELSVVDSFKAREQAVLSGRADVFMTDYPYGKRMQKLTKWAKLHSPPNVLAPTNYAYAVPKGQIQWLTTVDSFLDEMKSNGRLSKYAEKHGLTEIVLTK